MSNQPTILNALRLALVYVRASGATTAGRDAVAQELVMAINLLVKNDDPIHN